MSFFKLLRLFLFWVWFFFLQLSPASHQLLNSTMVYYSKIKTFSAQSCERGCVGWAPTPFGIPCVHTAATQLLEGLRAPKPTPGLGLRDDVQFNSVADLIWGPAQLFPPWRAPHACGAQLLSPSPPSYQWETVAFFFFAPSCWVKPLFELHQTPPHLTISLRGGDARRSLAPVTLPRHGKVAKEPDGSSSHRSAWEKRQL